MKTRAPSPFPISQWLSQFRYSTSLLITPLSLDASRWNNNLIDRLTNFYHLSVFISHFQSGFHFFNFGECLVAYLQMQICHLESERLDVNVAFCTMPLNVWTNFKALCLPFYLMQRGNPKTTRGPLTSAHIDSRAHTQYAKYIPSIRSRGEFA